MTSEGRLPDFVIAGERRSGTSALALYLRLQPKIYLHPKDDMAYFVDEQVRGAHNWTDGEPDYTQWSLHHSVEDYARKFVDGKGFDIVGEKSADYLFWRPAHPRIANYLPDAKFLITLRNPIDRAWSHYWNEVGKKRETLSFEEAIEAEETRSRNSAYARDHLSYTSRGKYDESFEAILEHIPADRIHITCLEALVAEPQSELNGVSRFLGLDPQSLKADTWKQINQNWTTIPAHWARYPILNVVDNLGTRFAERTAKLLARGPAKRRRIRQKIELLFRRPQQSIEMSRESRERLTNYYKEHISNLERLTGRNFGKWWLPRE